MGKLHGGIRDQNIKPPGLSAAALDVLMPIDLGFPIASLSAAVLTAGSALLSATAIGSTTAAPGTNIDVPRNLYYEINISGDATGMVASGTISVAGSDIRGSAITETVALSEIAAIGSASFVRGTKCFGTLAASAITISGYELATASSSRSKSISVFVGIGSHVGVPASIQSTGAIPYAFIGTLNQVGSFSVITGDIGTAAVSFSNALATNTPVHILRYVSR